MPSKKSEVNKVQKATIVGQEAISHSRSRTHISAKTRSGIKLIPLTKVKYSRAAAIYFSVASFLARSPGLA